MINENRELKQTVSELKSNVSFYKETTEGLYDRLDIATKKNKIWRDNAKKIMPKKEFKKLTRKINKLFKPFKAIATAVDIVKKVSKGISLWSFSIKTIAYYAFDVDVGKQEREYPVSVPFQPSFELGGIFSKEKRGLAP